MSGDSRLVVVCAAANYDGIKVTDAHLAERLADLVPVLYVDPPLSLLTPLRAKQPQLAAALKRPRLRQVRPNFWRLTPVVTPLPRRTGVLPLTAALTRRAMRRAFGEIGTEPTAILTTWPEFDVFSAAGDALKVWWAADDFAAGAELLGQRADMLARGQAARTEDSDLILVASPVLADRFQAQGHDVKLIPTGADAEAFAPVPEAQAAPEVSLQTPIAVLMGQLNERVDPAFLTAVADRGISLLLIGPEARSGADWLAPLAARPNVQWVGRQEFSELPRFLARAAVGLVPYADTDFNRSSFPLKTLEYLAAGLPVVTTDLPANAWLDAPPDLVRTGMDPGEFADQVVSAARCSEDTRERARAFAAPHSWQQRAADLLATIEQRRPAA